MKFAELFIPAPVRIARIVESLSFNLGEIINAEGKRINEDNHTRANAGLDLSALSAKPLVPIEQPFIEGQRYRLAGATEVGTRLDLYHADPNGPWMRRHGIIMAV
jgi:hypothetical protein